MRKINGLIGTTIIVLLVVTLGISSFPETIMAIVDTDIEVNVENLSKTDNPTSKTTYYVFKDPFDNKAIKQIGLEKSFADNARFSLDPGTYSIGAFNPELGWDVKVLNVTIFDAAKTINVNLKLKPVVENWTDLNGVFHEKLMVPTGSIPILGNDSDRNIAMQYYNQFYLIETLPFEQIYGKVGDLYSAPGVDVSMTLKFTGSMQSKYSINGGPLGVSGSTQATSSSAVSLGTLSDGDSREIMKVFDYEYHLWWYGPEGYTYFLEEWVETNMYSSSATLGGTSPAPSFKDIYNVDDIINAETQSQQVTLEFSEMSSYGWSIGQTVSLSGSWNYFSGSVPLGGSFSWTGYNQYDTIYTISTDAGRVIYLYKINSGNSPLTLQNDYWGTSTTGYGWISGDGHTVNEDGILGPFNSGTPAEIHAPSLSSAAYITVQLPHLVTGRINIWGEMQYPCTSGLIFAFVSADNVNWQSCSYVTANYNYGQRYYDLGICTGQAFRYVSISAYNQFDMPIDMHIYSVHVTDGNEYA